jgi:voltage-gated potassium channel
MKRIDWLRKDVAQLFRDDYTNQEKDSVAYRCKKLTDYTVLFFLLLSALEIFLSTFDSFSASHHSLLRVVDVVTTIVFTIEVSARIWTCGEIDEKYIGWKGRIKYCFSFYGLIDIISTFPFYVNFVISVPYDLLKVLRTARLFRIFRFLASVDILYKAFCSKRKELVISLQLLCIMTFILSILLFSVEHKVQPNVYRDGLQTLIWAFSQYIGQPQTVIDCTPVTTAGHVISFMIGILGIAIFAVPAGLIGSAFLEVIETQQKENETKENASRIESLMLLRSVKRENLYWPAINLTLGEIKITLGISEEEVLDAVSYSDGLRIKDLGSALPDDKKEEVFVVNGFFSNTSYGSCVDRDSNVTLVNAFGPSANGLSYFAWHVAKLGGFNYVANENFSRIAGKEGYRCAFWGVTDETKANEHFQQFATDILDFSERKDAWVVILAAEQPSRGTEFDFHFAFGGELHESSFDLPNSTVHDKEKLKTLFDDFSKSVEAASGYKTDAHQVLAPPKNNLLYYLHQQTPVNMFNLYATYNAMLFNKNNYKGMIAVADALSRNLESMQTPGLHTDDYKVRPL